MNLTWFVTIKEQQILAHQQPKHGTKQPWELKRINVKKRNIKAWWWRRTKHDDEGELRIIKESKKNHIKILGNFKMEKSWLLKNELIFSCLERHQQIIRNSRVSKNVKTCWSSLNMFSSSHSLIRMDQSTTDAMNNLTMNNLHILSLS